jgi:hypothetical protein
VFPNGFQGNWERGHGWRRRVFGEGEKAFARTRGDGLVLLIDAVVIVG